MTEARAWPVPAIAALAAAAALAVHGAGGLTTLVDSGVDNDSALRLVQIRDLIGGQGWFDLTQYRMGMPGGFEMHWSRLVDAPIALLILVAAPLLGQAGAETFAALAWPSLLFALSLGSMLSAARSLAGPAALLPAAVIGGVTLHLTGLFVPAAFDHHNMQLALALALAASLAMPGAEARAGLAAGACAALMLAVGMEALPLVAAAGAAVAIAWLIQGRAAAPLAICFGLGFAATAAIAFVATVPPARWSAATCDAFSIAQALPALVAGLGLAGIAAFAASAPDRPVRRLVLAGGIGLALAALALALFPACLADPYAGLPPLLRTLWLDHVEEANSALDLARDEPALLLRLHATPLLALALIAHAAATRGLARGEVMVGALLLAAFAVSLWQVRGANFSVPLAVIPLAAWVTEWRARQAAHGDLAASLRAASAWLVSFNLVWGAAGGAAVAAFEPARQEPEAGSAEMAMPCTARTAYDALASLQPATVLVISNLGAPMLAATPHRVLAGPYHRNIAGNLAALEMWTAAPDAAERLVRDAGVALVAVCPANPETAFLSRAAPDGLLAALARGQAVAWLEPVAGAVQDPLRLWRVRR